MNEINIRVKNDASELCNISLYSYIDKTEIYFILGETHKSFKYCSQLSFDTSMTNGGMEGG